ncbi:MAG: EAL domain-containing protein [Campylobacterota bacterium]|nr:EAL domain-containing protein [Campylobacterota bacterium]
MFLGFDNDKNIKKFGKNIQRVNGMILSQKNDNINQKLVGYLDDFSPDIIKTDSYLIKKEFFITSLPLYNHNDKQQGCVQISTDLNKVNSFVNSSKQNLLEQVYILIFVDILLLLSVLLILDKIIKRPVEKLVDSIAKIENSLDEADLKTLYANNQLTIKSNDEIGRIKTGLNLLLKRISVNFLKLQKSERYTQEYIKAVNAGSIVSKSDLKGIITYVNDTLCKNTGYTRDDLIGKPHNIFRHPSTSKSVFRNMWNTIQAGNIYNGLFKNKRKDGSAFYANITIVPIKNDKNEIVEYVALRDDVTELVNSKEQLKRTFFTDPLTSFSNRFKLLDDIETNKASYLAVIDIHGFRQINDFYGHKIGDLVIIDFANRLFDYFKIEGYNVYRVHGDEFAVLAKQKYTSKKEFFNNLQGFMDENKTHTTKIEDNDIGIRLTSGISYNNENLINETEIAHKTAKKEQKEIVEFSESIQTQEEYKNNLEWTNKIKEAIEDNRIKAFFQPIVNTKNGKIEKYETLMRLIEKDGKEISPFFFLDIAKKSRLYKELTKIVVTQAFEKFSNTKYEFSVNLSAEDIMLHNISEWFFELACEYKVHNQVVIELVESEGIESFDMVDTFIHNAKENGMQIAIDDFGTGYSNFEYLIKLNTDYLKIDGSLIKEIDSDEKLYSVVETMVQFAKKNDIKVIAEFIANERLYEKIKELDIEYGQGFYLGKPNKELQ